MRIVCALVAFVVSAASVRAGTESLPRYDYTITLDTKLHRADIRLTATWTNQSSRPTDQVVFNFYPLYRIPEGDHLLLAKTLELLRVNPSDGVDRRGRSGSVGAISLLSINGRPLDAARLLEYHYRSDNPTAIVAQLPEPVPPGKSVVVELTACIRLPNKQGRWGYWNEVHYLTNALPVFAYHCDDGWKPVPFIPWHQPFWNEAGHYNVSLRVPVEQNVACSAVVKETIGLPNGWKQITYEPFLGRDFAILASHCFQEYTSAVTLPDGHTVTLKCLAFPRHEHYAREMLRYVAEALPVYCEWFGPFPYSQFSIAESYFGWNGNECSGLVMIDERVFDAPHLAGAYLEYLISHETCHQYWYNVVGTNGYAETFIDEGAATHFTHRLMDRKHGKNHAFLKWPAGFEWLPNIHRENYRYSSMYGAIGRDEMPAAAMELPGFNHLVGLFSGAYDRGSKVYGMIEARLGPAEFEAFIRELVDKYRWRVLSAQALREELECHTGQSWGEFFERWVYAKGMTDWEVEQVTSEPARVGKNMVGTAVPPTASRRVSVVVRQSAEYDELTTVGFQMRDGDGYSIRVPVGPIQADTHPEYDAVVTPLPGRRLRVEVTLPGEPANVKVDPDGVLLDRNLANNVWKNPPRMTLTPLYTVLNESDLTNDIDRWNFAAGPWVGGALYPDPWFTRSTMVGVRAGAFRTQKFVGGGYAAYRTDFRDLVVGADGLLDHWPYPHTQLGFNVEQRIDGPYGDVEGRDTAFRAAGFARYVWQYSSSLYLPPLAYTEGFTTYQDNFLPFARDRVRGAVRPDWTWLNGIHTRVNLYTPYWDPECGFWFDLSTAGGTVRLERQVGTFQGRGEFAVTKKLPWDLGPLTDTRAAARIVVAGATPDRAQFFALGGGTLFRGFDLAERQGSFLWVANAELRLPLCRRVNWDVLDHLAGGRNLWLAAFYDVGAVYSDGRRVGSVAHAVGTGLRLDATVFSFIERVTLRVDVAKTLNAASPVQVWFGVQHAF